MTIVAETLFNNAEFSLAAYSNLIAGIPTGEQIAALRNGGQGMTQIQATEFAARYTDVIAVANEPLSKNYRVGSPKK